jgi:hypothetical protein
MPTKTTTKKPISRKRLAANRANAAQSTGPRSPEGKSRSAQNARKHGFTASTFTVVRLEELEEVAHLRDDAIAFYQPLNSQELYAVERIALAQQSMLRAARLEAGTATNCINEAFDGGGRPNVMLSSLLINKDNEITKPQNRNYLFAEGLHRLAKESNCISLFMRYQAHAERLYRRAIEEFNRLKALRGELPNQPILQTQPEANETVNPPEPNPANPGNPANPANPANLANPGNPANLANLANLANPGNPGNPGSPGNLSPAGNTPGQPPQFRPDGELLLVDTSSFSPDAAGFPPPDPHSPSQ